MAKAKQGQRRDAGEAQDGGEERGAVAGRGSPGRWAQA